MNQKLVGKINEFEVIPIEITTIIMKLCDIHTIMKLSSTCKMFHKMIGKDNLLWKHFLNRDFDNKNDVKFMLSIEENRFIIDIYIDCFRFFILLKKIKSNIKNEVKSIKDLWNSTN